MFGAGSPNMTGGSFPLQVAPDPTEPALTLRIWDFEGTLLLELP